MNYDHIVFDLDGTLSDPKVGIVRSINHALQAHDFSVRPEEELTPFIGPSLESAFTTLTGSDDAGLISSLIEAYRDRYANVGFSENHLYPGVVEALETLSATKPVGLGVCTAKRVDMAERILSRFAIRHFFQFVDGGDVGIEKRHQLSRLLQKGAINGRSVMVGDRDLDITAAHHNRLRSAGVLWGYGSHDELSRHKPAHMLSHPAELTQLVA